MPPDTDPTPDPAAPRIAELEAALARAERGRAIDARLLDAGALDIETARLLADRAIDATPEASDESIVAALRKSKPFLFKPASPPSRPPARSMGAAPSVPASSPAELAAADALKRGDRASLLRYLRLRRQT